MKLSADKSAWLDQIEDARLRLMLAVRSAPLTTAQSAVSDQIDYDVQRFVDIVIDAETMRRAA